MMRAMSFCLLVLFLQILSLVGVSSRHLDLEEAKLAWHILDHHAVYGPKSLQINHAPAEDMKKRAELMEELRTNKELNKIGSSPPSCEHKCYGCMPCEAIQVPTSTGRVGVQYTNYEPEGWKCKCGPALYSP